MKHVFKLSMITLLIFQANCYSQTNCNLTSTFWSNNLNFIPSTSDSSFNIPLNIIILRRSDGTGNFPNDSLTQKIFSDAVDILNFRYDNLVPLDSSAYDSCFNTTLGEPSFIPSINLQFYLNNIIFVDSSVFWGTNGYYNVTSDINSLTYYIESLVKGINIYFPMESIAWQRLVIEEILCYTCLGINWATMPSEINMDPYPYHHVVAPNKYAEFLYQLNVLQWTPADAITHNKAKFANIFAHEIGHVFGLQHVCQHYSLNECRFSFMHQGAWDANWLPPSEIGRMHRLIHTSSARRHLPAQTYLPSKKYIVSNYQLWDYNLRVYGDIIIENGGIIELRCILHMPKLAKIIVKPGGKLIVNGGRITSYGNYLWQGIEVWGTTSASQFTAGAQGRVELKNGAVIENAINGIRNWNPNDWNARGGIIVSNNAVFRNNRRAVEFVQYHNIRNGIRFNDLSSFTNTRFEVDNNYIGPNIFHAHVSMWDVRGVNFYGCTFENNISNKSWSANHHMGIRSIDAGYLVTGICAVTSVSGQECPANHYQPSVFRNFNYAIKASGSSTSNTINIHRNVFENNVVAIDVNALNNVKLNRNNILLGNGHAQGASFNYGIYISNSTGFQVEENTVNSVVSSPYSTGGIAVVNSGSNNNLIYRNTVHNMNRFGFLAKGLNMDPTAAREPRGLQFLCNQNFNNTLTANDFRVFSQKDLLGVELGGIREWQGVRGRAAGNIFTQGMQTQFGHFNNTSTLIRYFHSGGSTQPINFTGLSLKGTTANPCTPTVVPPDNGSGNINQLQQAANNYDAAETMYKNLSFTHNLLIDEGNTQAMIDDIKNTWNEDAWALRNKLIPVSPYLSKEALTEAAQTEIMPNAMLLEVTLQNPEASFGNEFISVVTEELSQPMPQYMIDIVKASWMTENPRTVLEASMSDLSFEMSLSSNKILSSLKTDSVHHKSQILSWLHRRESFDDLLFASEILIHNNEFSDAATVLSNLLAQCNIKQNQIDEITDYFAYLNFRQSVDSQNKTISELNEPELNQLLTLAETASSQRVKAMSNNILCFFYEKCETVDYLSDSPAIGTPKKQSAFASSTNTSENYRIKVYPNPAVTYATYEWKISENELHSTIRISTTYGRIVESFTLQTTEGSFLWDTRSLSDGVYVYELLGTDNQRIESGRISVVK